MSYTLAKFTRDMLDLPAGVEHLDVIVNTPAGWFLVRGIHPAGTCVEIDAVKVEPSPSGPEETP